MGTLWDYMSTPVLHAFAAVYCVVKCEDEPACDTLMPVYRLRDASSMNTSARVGCSAAALRVFPAACGCTCRDDARSPNPSSSQGPRRAQKASTEDIQHLISPRDLGARWALNAAHFAASLSSALCKEAGILALARPDAGRPQYAAKSFLYKPFRSNICFLLLQCWRCRLSFLAEVLHVHTHAGIQ